MGIMTISVNDGVEKEIRRLAAYKHGQKKGAISEVISEAVNNYLKVDQMKSNREDEIAKEQMALSRKGFNIGYKYVAREKLWGRM